MSRAHEIFAAIPPEYWMSLFCGFALGKQLDEVLNNMCDDHDDDDNNLHLVNKIFHSAFCNIAQNAMLSPLPSWLKSSHNVLNQIQHVGSAERRDEMIDQMKVVFRVIYADMFRDIRNNEVLKVSSQKISLVYTLNYNLFILKYDSRNCDSSFKYTWHELGIKTLLPRCFDEALMVMNKRHGSSLAFTADMRDEVYKIYKKFARPVASTWIYIDRSAEYDNTPKAFNSQLPIVYDTLWSQLIPCVIPSAETDASL